MSVPPRMRLAGGLWFFTVVLQSRQNNPILLRHVDTLRTVVARTKARHPFAIHAWVVLPDHLHCILELPPGDDNFPLRWRLIKSGFSRALPDKEWRTPQQLARRERGVWQKRYWEHRIRDDNDYWRHMDYVHFNPVRHGCVLRAVDWPWSTFHRLVRQGIYPYDWAWQEPSLDDYPD